MRINTMGKDYGSTKTAETLRSEKKFPDQISYWEALQPIKTFQRSTGIPASISLRPRGGTRRMPPCWLVYGGLAGECPRGGALPCWLPAMCRGSYPMPTAGELTSEGGSELAVNSVCRRLTVCLGNLATCMDAGCLFW